jgi:hypothetical protein
MQWPSWKWPDRQDMIGGQLVCQYSSVAWERDSFSSGQNELRIAKIETRCTGCGAGAMATV